MTRIEAAAAAMADTEAAEEAARGPLAAAIEEVATVRARVDALELEREAIRRRRGAGDPRPDDGEKLGLIALDAENLAEILAGAEARVAVAREAHRRLYACLYIARDEMSAASSGAEAAALHAHALGLARVLRETLDRHRSATAAFRSRDDLEHARAGMMAIADELDPALLGVMRDISALGARYGAHRIAWAPSPALVFEARRADLVRENTEAACRARGLR